ncbi:MAG: hypothetical protein UY57_C0031G0004 [Candidatus Kaiserbacteria bacterium GW2011_GWB1_50_17]|uniref:Endolytic murein transglycosylase n=1 Tax=Candidatus Kaiserbacteria bacterium GW2011_GWB1_50_17 TaxID=1618673 RepID=A0A0G1WDJ5_9BACT|nr:MAG: hypothetical protein UY57_C0031G0004 [Candidatus Kaiserbacteria bacterium GW2011_GWB1_50_17]
MKNFNNILKKALDKTHVVIEKFLSYSRENANQRTLIIVPVIVVVILIPYLVFIRPPSAFPAGELVEIPEGLSLSEIAELLEREQVVRSATLFRSAVYVFGRERNVKFGDYFFKEPRNAFIVARALSYGVYGLEPIRIRVSEGTMVREMASLFAVYLKRFDEERFLSEARPMEGYLFPDTYFFLPNADDRLVLRTLRQSFYSRTVELEEEISASGRSLEDIVINAVFLYSLGRTTFELTSADLASDSPYNTYRVRGLPPTPIGSPSFDSLRAAVTPIKSDYLYYLADRNNVTHFSETYEKHVEKKRLYLGG